jgi:hypothetical protein
MRPNFAAKGVSYGCRGESYERFASDISKLLTERGYALPKQAPNVWEMLKNIGESHFYQLYILLSAYTHANFEAGTLYRNNLGCGKELGEFITAKDWHLPLEVAWSSFFLIARDFLYCVEADIGILSRETPPRL